MLRKRFASLRNRKRKCFASLRRRKRIASTRLASRCFENQNASLQTTKNPPSSNFNFQWGFVYQPNDVSPHPASSGISQVPDHSPLGFKEEHKHPPPLLHTLVSGWNESFNTRKYYWNTVAKKPQFDKPVGAATAEPPPDKDSFWICCWSKQQSKLKDFCFWSFLKKNAI